MFFVIHDAMDCNDGKVTLNSLESLIEANRDNEYAPFKEKARFDGWGFMSKDAHTLVLDYYVIKSPSYHNIYHVDKRNSMVMGLSAIFVEIVHEKITNTSKYVAINALDNSEAMIFIDN